MDAALATYGPDAAWDVSLLGLEGVFEGPEAIRGVYEDLLEPYDELELVAQDFLDLGNGVTFAVDRARGRTRDGTRFGESPARTVSIRANGLIERTTFYSDPDEARAAAEGLAQE